MNESLETKLHNYLKEQNGKQVPYQDVKYLVEYVWITLKGGHYRMETLTRRARKDATKRENDISTRIGKVYKGNAITHFYYKPIAEMNANISIRAEEFMRRFPSQPIKEVKEVKNTLW